MSRKHIALLSMNIKQDSETNTNSVLFNKYLSQFQSEDCKLPEAAALAKLVEHCIINKTYRIYNSEEIYTDSAFEVIVIFNFAGDPLFGIYGLNDGEPIISYSTPNGVKILSL